MFLQLLRLAQIRLGHLTIDPDGGGPSGINTNIHVHVTAPQTIAKHAADFRLERLQPLGQAKMQIEEAVVYAAQAHA